MLIKFSTSHGNTIYIDSDSIESIFVLQHEPNEAIIYTKSGQKHTIKISDSFKSEILKTKVQILHDQP